METALEKDPTEIKITSYNVHPFRLQRYTVIHFWYEFQPEYHFLMKSMWTKLFSVSAPLFHVSLCHQMEIPSADHCIHFRLDSSSVHNYLHQKFSLEEQNKGVSMCQVTCLCTFGIMLPKHVSGHYIVCLNLHNHLV